MSEIRLVCTGGGRRHQGRVRQLDRFMPPPEQGGRWESAAVHVFGAAEARRMGVVDLNGIWWFRCPSCPGELLTSPVAQLDRALSAAAARGAGEIDLSMPLP